MTEQPKLTVSQAIEQGYEHYLIDGQDWGSLLDISDLDPSGEGYDWENDLVLAEKEFQTEGAPDNETIAEMIAEYICCNSDMGDTEDLFDELKRIDYSEVIKQMENICEQHRYKMATNIRLVPDENK